MWSYQICPRFVREAFCSPISLHSIGGMQQKEFRDTTAEEERGHLSACRIKVFSLPIHHTNINPSLPPLPPPPRERSNRGEGHKTRRREKRRNPRNKCPSPDIYCAAMWNGYAARHSSVSLYGKSLPPLPPTQIRGYGFSSDCTHV